jgi:hypothetical protein
VLQNTSSKDNKYFLFLVSKKSQQPCYKSSVKKPKILLFLIKENGAI